MNNLTKRILSAVTLAPITLYIIYIGGIAYYVLVGIACLIMLWEWVNMTKSSPKKYLWWLAGFIYITPPSLALATMNEKGEWFNLQEILFTIILAVWATDIFAYVFGKTIGGPKIAPKISPNKTWAGLVGGIIGATIICYFFSRISLFIAPFIAITAQIGDFFISWIKRKFNIKDTSNIIPGHGGLLDRIDGLLGVMWAILLATLILKILL